MSRAFAAASSQYIISSSVPLSSLPLTIALWCKPTDVSGEEYMLSLATSTSGGNWIDMRMLGAFFGFRANPPDTTAWVSGMVGGTWNHVCGVARSDGTYSGYRAGGNRVDGTGFTFPASINRVGIGALVRSSIGGYFDGLIAEVYVWNVELSHAEVADVYAGKLVRPASLVFASHLAGNSFASQIGPAMSNNGSTDSSDHPSARYRNIPQALFGETA